MTSIVQAVIDTARSKPRRIAIDADGGLTTYEELLQSSSSTAAALRSRNIGAGDIVAVRLPPSSRCISAMLGVMIAGAAYLPLDVRVPAMRAKRFVEISGACAVVADEPEASFGVPSLSPSVLQNTGAGSERLTGPDPESLAYVMFTSGSTGDPKGVMCEHGPVARVTGHYVASGYVDESARVLFRTSIGFDLSVWEMFAPLMAGATVVIGNDDLRADPEHLAAEVVAMRISTLQMVPTLMRYFAPSFAAYDAHDLRYVISGGEALDARLADEMHRSSGATIVNTYGPTEVTMTATTWECSFPSPEEVPLGTPLCGAQVRVVEERLCDVAGGVVGEIVIGGSNLARGYVGRSDLTNEKFRPDPLNPGRRIYLTGDRGHFGADQLLYYDGRADRQVKVGGVRIELDEVERVMAKLLAGRHTAAIAVKNTFGDTEMIAFVAGRCEVRPLREQLRHHLPDSMTPSRIISLERLPMLPNGKTDYVMLRQAALGAADGS